MPSAITAKANATIAVPPSPGDSRSSTVRVASAPSATLTVSQPTTVNQVINVGRRLPSTPNAARLNIIAGAPPRVPATATAPTSGYDRPMPMTTASMACHQFSPTATTSRP